MPLFMYKRMSIISNKKDIQKTFRLSSFYFAPFRQTKITRIENKVGMKSTLIKKSRSSPNAMTAMFDIVSL